MPTLTIIGIAALSFELGYLTGLFQALKTLKKELAKAEAEALKAIEEAQKTSMQ